MNVSGTFDPGTRRHQQEAVSRNDNSSNSNSSSRSNSGGDTTTDANIRSVSKGGEVRAEGDARGNRGGVGSGVVCVVNREAIGGYGLVSLDTCVGGISRGGIRGGGIDGGGIVLDTVGCGGKGSAGGGGYRWASMRQTASETKAGGRNQQEAQTATAGAASRRGGGSVEGSDTRAVPSSSASSASFVYSVASTASRKKFHATYLQKQLSGRSGNDLFRNGNTNWCAKEEADGEESSRERSSICVNLAASRLPSGRDMTSRLQMGNRNCVRLEPESRGTQALTLPLELRPKVLLDG
ncbi:glycine, alanine and asparagine-rich protein-like [Penaeus japonicus]|uniref:glycine, alanine and asparagine-rich protein-like n=1 Tax=Penaeus japonicus TaxID=27405 RepID=UPI001C716786|nr:glycine, alanine and asparagine-rich protein-like [Penaeus japonicus]